MKRKFYTLFASTLKLNLLIGLLFSCVIGQAQTYTIDFPNSPPANSHASLSQNDATGMGIVTAVKFRVTQIGTITGIRFLKGTSVTGLHIGELYNNGGGAPLASVTFTEPPGVFGWLEASFSTPVAVTPGNIYVATLFSEEGYYAFESGTWADQGGQDHGTDPIRVMAYSNVTPNGNGAFAYTDNAIYPPNGTDDNYWIDVRFDPTFTLPVTLSDIKATSAANSILISWKTSTEENNKGFEIQRSNNNADWYAIGFVDGVGESTVTRSYSHNDKGLAPGTYYYRLKQVDFDGKSKISTVVSATVGGKGSVSLSQNYPNPFSNTTTIRFDLPSSQRIRLSVFDITGREVKVLLDNTSNAGTHQVSLDRSGLASQMYTIRLRTEAGTLSRQILIQ